MTKRDIALAVIRREVAESGELTVTALRAAHEHRIGYAAMMAAARRGMQLRERQLREIARGRSAALPSSGTKDGPSIDKP